MRVISVVNQKGGVAKTVSAGCLAVTYARRGHKVLGIDVDGQHNFTTLAGHEPTVGGTYEALLPSADGEPTIDGCSVPTAFGFDLVPASPDLATAEHALAAAPGGQTHLRGALAAASNGYDYVIVDAPPNLGLLTINALVAADVLAVPVKASSYFATKALQTLIGTNRRVGGLRGGNPAPIVPFTTLSDPRKVIDQDIAETLRKNFGEDLVVIPEAVAVENEAAESRPYVWRFPDSRIAQRYRDLADRLDTALGGTE